MKKIILFIYFIHFMSSAQNDAFTLPPESEMVSMNDANVKYGTLYGQQYFANGSEEPYTGWLCARYDNGELEAVQQFRDGVGNRVWINYNPDGSKESQGTYVNNKTEGPAILFYDDGNIKAKGNYIHLKRKVGWWYFYDREGNILSKLFFTK